jgi:hypothetical protein
MGNWQKERPAHPPTNHCGILFRRELLFSGATHTNLGLLLQTFFAFSDNDNARLGVATEAGRNYCYFADPRGVSNPDICPGSIIGNADDMTAISVLVCI